MARHAALVETVPTIAEILARNVVIESTEQSIWDRQSETKRIDALDAYLQTVTLR